MGVKAKFTIQRISKPKSPNRYLATDEDGQKVWARFKADFDVFDSGRAAHAYRNFRMAGHAADCHVVRHAVH